MAAGVVEPTSSWVPQLVQQAAPAETSLPRELERHFDLLAGMVCVPGSPVGEISGHALVDEETDRLYEVELDRLTAERNALGSSCARTAGRTTPPPSPR